MPGGGAWSDDVYETTRSSRADSGIRDFAYSDTIRSRSVVDREVHPLLNPHGVTRESRDSDEHPESNAIITFLDGTGSMGQLPPILLNKLPQLVGTIIRNDLLPHPQVLFGAVQDHNSDGVPLQVGQFESDERMAEDLDKVVLEGGGGPYGRESYELALYFAAFHTIIDCLEKRRKKGYLFLIGDEIAYPAVNRSEASRIFGDSRQENVSFEEIVRAVKERFNVFFIIPTMASGGSNHSVFEFWSKHFGQNVLKLEQPDAICETIALAIGINEGAIGLEDGLDILRDTGADARTIRSISTALEVLPGSSAVKAAEGSLPGLVKESSGPDTTRRL